MGGRKGSKRDKETEGCKTRKIKGERMRLKEGERPKKELREKRRRNGGQEDRVVDVRVKGENEKA